MIAKRGIYMSKQTKRRIAIYARVSTEHEAQLFALDNQVDWYDSIAIQQKYNLSTNDL